MLCPAHVAVAHDVDAAGNDDDDPNPGILIRDFLPDDVADDERPDQAYIIQRRNHRRARQAQGFYLTSQRCRL